MSASASKSAWRALTSKRVLLSSVALGVGSATYLSYNSTFLNDEKSAEGSSIYARKFAPLLKQLPAPPSREELLSRLGKAIQDKFSNEQDKIEAGDFSAKDADSHYDLIIVGGGAVGSGAALDAATRGLNVLLLEKNDFASGTSSKSTKMAHGGVRYLEKAIFQLSKAQLDLVIEALNERASILENAPHLATVLPILIPVYKYWQLPYFYAGCLLYDLFAGRQALKYSYIMTKSSTMEKHPQLDGTDLVGGLVYHDGLFNDARVNVSIALTALKNGATVLNYMEVNQLLKNEQGQTKGVRVMDRETGREYLVEADSVINATGPFSDVLLEMDKDPKGLPPKNLLPPKMVVPSGGVHIILPEWYCAKDMGLLDASTSDGRVMFFLPWQGKVLCGTTDVPLNKVPETPVATEVEIDDIIKELQHYVKFEVKREDVLSAWCGVRPLVRDPSKLSPEEDGKPGSTQGLVRSHLVYHTSTGLTTISGGKWTTYREMAEDVINQVIAKSSYLQSKATRPCQTRSFKLVGGETFDKTLNARLAQEYGIPEKLSSHLANNYGDRAPIILEMMKSSKENSQPITLSTESAASYMAYDHPFTVAELKYSIQYEYARHPLDFLARRCRLAFLDAKQALAAVDRVTDIMADELKWNSKVKEQYRNEASKYIERMGIKPNATPYDGSE